MAVLAFCNNSKTIWQIDTALVLAPLVRYERESNIHSLAPHQSEELTLIWGLGGSLEIRQTQGSTDTPVYKHSKSTTMLKVRTREVAGQERVYFSVAEGGDFDNVKIYYLQSHSPVLYYTVNRQDLKVPHPCVEGETVAVYSGDFVFGPGETMYLSSGNFSGLFQAGIFEVSGAGPDNVTGDVTRINLGQGPIESLCYVGSDTLFFLRSSKVFSLDLATKTEKLEYDIAGLTPGDFTPRDLVQAPPGNPPFYVFKLILAVLFWFWERVFVALRYLAWGRGRKSRDDIGQLTQKQHEDS